MAEVKQDKQPSHDVAHICRDDIGKVVTIIGHVDVVRDRGKIRFVTVRQGQDRIQVVDVNRVKLSEQSYVAVTGIVRSLPANKYSMRPFEIEAQSITVLSEAASDYPHRCPKAAGRDIQLAHRHLAIREEEFALRQELQDALVDCMERYLRKSGMSKVFPPSFTSLQCEGGATLFKVGHPGKTSAKSMEVFLNQSAQFYLEWSIAARGRTGVYCVAPSFRAERSHTRRHLTEFLHLETEWRNIFTLEDHAAKLSDMLKGALDLFVVEQKDVLTRLKLYDHVVAQRKLLDDVMMLDHKDAIALCNQYGFHKETDDGKTVPFDERDDIPEKQERALIDKLGKVVFLTRFPREFKSFYMGLDPKDPTRVLGIDVEVPGVGEVIGSGIREASPGALVDRLKEQGLDPATYEAYIDLRRYGFSFTSGMGLGVGRIMTWLLKQESIQDVTEYPRFPGYAAP